MTDLPATLIAAPPRVATALATTTVSDKRDVEFAPRRTTIECQPVHRDRLGRYLSPWR